DTLTEVENTIHSNQSQADAIASQNVIDCDKHRSESQNCGEPAIRSTLSKKAMSQIVYPSNQYSAVSPDSVQYSMASNSPKSGLSHSLSFTINSNLSGGNSGNTT